MSSKRKGAKYLALFAASSVALTACSTGGGDGGGSAGEQTSEGAGTKDQTITVAWEDEFGSYNNNTAEENAVKNTVVLNQVLRGFWFFGADGSLTPDTEFGTFEKTSDDPLKVKYTFNENAVWSDGEKIDCDDFLLVWAANSGVYKAAGSEEPLFSTAGTSGYDQLQKPDCADGDQTIEITYTTPFADWQSLFGGFLPAHVVEQQSGVADLIEAIKTDNIAELTKAAKFYNTGWVMNPGELNKEITPSAGPYVIDSWEANQSLTLKANDKWWGTPPKSSTIVFRFISPEQQAQALQNNEVQVINPQAQPDLVNQLKAIGDSVVVESGDQYTYEHLDFNFTGEFKDPDLRKAFAMCVPRQTIVDNLIKPVNPNAVVLNSRYAYPFQSDYQDIVSATVGTTYDKPDIAGAKALLESKGKTGMTVRIGYNTPNPRRTSQVALIRDSCNQAGFAVQDLGSDDFFGNGLSAGNFDVALFAWAGSPLVTGSSSTFITGGGNNNGKYSNPKVDQLIKQLDQTTDVGQQGPLITQIEKILWDDLATVPVFAFPGVQAYSSNVTGVKFQPSQTQVTWNMNEWDLKS